MIADCVAHGRPRFKEKRIKVYALARQPSKLVLDGKGGEMPHKWKENTENKEAESKSGIETNMELIFVVKQLNKET